VSHPGDKVLTIFDSGAVAGRVSYCVIVAHRKFASAPSGKAAMLFFKALARTMRPPPAVNRPPNRSA
jgi:hypothetical protein